MKINTISKYFNYVVAILMAVTLIGLVSLNFAFADTFSPGCRTTGSGKKTLYASHSPEVLVHITVHYLNGNTKTFDVMIGNWSFTDNGLEGFEATTENGEEFGALCSRPTPTPGPTRTPNPGPTNTPDNTPRPELDLSCSKDSNDPSCELKVKVTGPGSGPNGRPYELGPNGIRIVIHYLDRTTEELTTTNRNWQENRNNVEYFSVLVDWKRWSDQYGEAYCRSPYSTPTETSTPTATSTTTTFEPPSANCSGATNNGTEAYVVDPSWADAVTLNPGESTTFPPAPADMEVYVDITKISTGQTVRKDLGVCNPSTATATATTTITTTSTPPPTPTPTVASTPIPDGQAQVFLGGNVQGSGNHQFEYGKESFLGTLATMLSLEWPTSNQAEIVYRENGVELTGINVSMFHDGQFEEFKTEETRQEEIRYTHNENENAKVNLDFGRAVVNIGNGPNKAIVYHRGQEVGMLYHTNGATWVKPLSMPFEHKPEFTLEVHSIPSTTITIQYSGTITVPVNSQGLATVTLSYQKPGLVYIFDETSTWTTGMTHRLDITSTRVVTHAFAEANLSAYRLVDGQGNGLVEGSDATVNWLGQPGQWYVEQYKFPATSVYVSMINDMQYQHKPLTKGLIDPKTTVLEDWYIDIERLPDTDLADGQPADAKVKNVHLLFNGDYIWNLDSYLRSDNNRPGVHVFRPAGGGPSVAACIRPGTHEAGIFLGGWGNVNYYDPSMGYVVDEEKAKAWTEEWKQDCVDYAERINKVFAYEGLLTRHTYKEHGEQSMEFQLNNLGATTSWAEAGLPTPHVASILYIGRVLKNDLPNDVLFWGWSIEKGGLSASVNDMQSYLNQMPEPHFVDWTK